MKGEGGALEKMMCKIFFNSNFFPEINAAVGGRSVAQNRKRGGKTIADS